MFKALVVDKDGEGKVSAAVKELSEEQLPEADVTVAVEYSTVNYKDGLCITGGGGLVRKYPHVPGIDFAGTVESSADDRYKPGDKVVLTGWRVGEAWWGGYSQKARVKADWLVPMPEGLDAKRAMAVGTAGFTAMLAVMALEDHGLAPGNGPVLVTGAAGGVGSAVVQLAKRRGAEVLAVAGESKCDRVRRLGADQVLARGSDLAAQLGGTPVDVVIDNVAGAQFGQVLKLLSRGGRHASSGAIAGPITTIDMRDFYLKDLTLFGCTAWDESVFPNLVAYIEKGEIRPLVAKVFELKDIVSAQQEFLKKAHFGNFVLVPPQ